MKEDTQGTRCLLFLFTQCLDDFICRHAHTATQSSRQRAKNRGTKDEDADAQGKMVQ